MSFFFCLLHKMKINQSNKESVSDWSLKRSLWVKPPLGVEWCESLRLWNILCKTSPDGKPPDSLFLFLLPESWTLDHAFHNNWLNKWRHLIQRATDFHKALCSIFRALPCFVQLENRLFFSTDSRRFSTECSCLYPLLPSTWDSCCDLGLHHAVTAHSVHRGPLTMAQSLPAWPQHLGLFTTAFLSSIIIPDFICSLAW